MSTLAHRRSIVLVFALACACGTGTPAGSPDSREPETPAPTWSVEPANVHFDAVPAGERAERRVTLRNPGTVELPVAAGWLAGSDSSLSLPGVPPAIPAGGAVDVVIAYGPRAAGEHDGRLGIEAGGVVREVGVSGVSPAAWLTCLPEVLTLAPVAVGEEARATVACVAGGLPVAIRSLAVTGDGFTATFGTSPPEEGLAPGELLPIDVAFRADTPGPRSGTLALSTSAGEATVSLSARAWAIEPCELGLPGTYDLGLVPPGLRARVQLPIENLRPDAGCRIDAARLAACSPGFRLETTGPFVLAPGETLELPLRFSAESVASYRCELALAAGEQPERRVALRAYVDPTCLRVAPTLDFGEVEAGCRRALPLEVHSVCGPDLVLEAVELASDLFFGVGLPALPARISHGQVLPLGFDFRPVWLGPGVNDVRLWFADGLEAVTVRLVGTGTPAQGDVFYQNPRPKADTLFVIDNSTAMAEELEHVAEQLEPFLAYAQAQEVDFHLGITTTGLEPDFGCPGEIGGGEDGRLVPVDGSRARWLALGTSHQEAIWVANLAVGACRGGRSMALEAALRALSPPVSDHADDPRHPEPADGNAGFLRADADLRVIFVTVRADESPRTVASYVETLRALKPGRDVDLHAFTGDPETGCSDGASSAEPGDRLVAAAQATDGGVFESFCDPDWEVSLREASAMAFGFKTCFFLSRTPEDRNEDGAITDDDLLVYEDGRLTPPRGEQHQQIWSYRAGENAVCFNPLAVPEPGVEIRVEYTRTCE